jgi:hypothetical protein
MKGKSDILSAVSRWDSTQMGISRWNISRRSEMTVHKIQISHSVCRVLTGTVIRTREPQMNESATL